MMRHEFARPEFEAGCEQALTRQRPGQPKLRALLAVLLAAALGCSGDDEAQSGGGGNPFANAGDRDDGNDETGLGIGRPRGETGIAGSGGGASSSEVCKHVDVAIAVDGSMSMTEELQAMRRDIFPAFGRRLREIGAGLDDFRVATLDACPEPANFHTRGARGECDFEGGHPWIESSSSAMDDEFACVGDIYLEDQECSGDNDDEQPASALATALESPAGNGPNAGFQRRDALLIAIAITDEDEQPTSDARSPEEVYNRLAELVADDPRRMVFLGIGGASDCQGAYGEANEARELRQITSLFQAHDRGVFWDLCQGRLEDGLNEAFRVIEEACNDLCELDGDCAGDPPEGGDPLFCQDFPDDPSCIVD